MLLWQKYNKHVLEGMKESEEGVLEKYPFVEFDGKLRVVDIVLLMPVAALLGVNVFVALVVMYVVYKRSIRVRSVFSVIVARKNMVLFGFCSWLFIAFAAIIPVSWVNLSDIGKYVVLPPVIFAETTPRVLIVPLLVGWAIAPVYFLLCLCSFRKVVCVDLRSTTRKEMLQLSMISCGFIFFGVLMSYFLPPSRNGVHWAYVGIPASLGCINVGVLGAFYSVPALLNRRTMWRVECKDQRQ